MDNNDFLWGRFALATLGAAAFATCTDFLVFAIAMTAKSRPAAPVIGGLASPGLIFVILGWRLMRTERDVGAGFCTGGALATILGGVCAAMTVS